MFTNILVNTLFAFLAFSVSGGVALHDSRVDKVFATVASATELATHDLGHAVSHDFHIHGSRHGISETANPNPGIRDRSHKKHITLHHMRSRHVALKA